MRPSDIKKIAFSFLALAVVIGTIVFIASKAQTKTAQEDPPFTVEGSKIAEVGKNAFVEKLDSLEGGGPNLTDALAQNFAEEILRLNPEGPLPTTKGGEAVAPAPEEVIEKFANNKDVVEKILVRESAEVPRFRTYTASSPGELTEYLSRVHALLQEDFLSANLQNIFVNDPTAESANAAEVALGGIINDLVKMEVPRTFENLHRELLASLVHSRNVIGINSGDDPLYALFAMQDEERLAQVAVENLIREAEAIKSKKISLKDESILSELFGMPTAHAQVPLLGVPISDLTGWSIATADATTNTASKVQKILEWGRKIATEWFKDRIVHRLVQQTINWVQGGGKPQFVTNWKGFLGDAGKAAESDIITSIAPRLCRSFGPLVQVSLLPVNTTPEKAITCTLDQVVSNIKDFAQSFKNGGWIAYGASLEAQNNVFGGFILASDLALQAKVAAENATEAEAQSGGGFLSSKKCVKPISPFDACMKNCDAKGGSLSATQACYSTCQLLSSAKTMCEPDGWTITTPGDTVAQITSDSFAAPLLRIVNAQDIAALTNALINSGLTKLVDLAKRNDGRPGQSGKGLTDIQTNQIGGQQTGMQDICAGLSGRERTNCEANACQGLTGDDLAECRGSLAAGRPAEEPFCRVNMGEELIGDTPRAGSGDFAAGGAYCDNETITVSETRTVRFTCKGRGEAFITQDLTRCNEPGLGWTFGEGGVKNNNGDPVTMIATVACGASTEVTLDPGNYSIGAWTMDPNGGPTAGVCASGFQIIEVTPPQTTPPASP